jgi:hypothetical protein
MLDRFPITSLDFFFNSPNPFSPTMALGSTQPPTEISTRKLTGIKLRPLHKAENFTAVYCMSRLSRKIGNLDASQSYGSPWSITEVPLPFCVIRLFIRN